MGRDEGRATSGAAVLSARVTILTTMPPSARLEYRFATRLVADPTVRRTIALLATQTLDDLHHAVRNAHGWDDDHLYAIWVSGRYWAGDGSEYTHPIHAEMPDPLAAYTGRRPEEERDHPARPASPEAWSADRVRVRFRGRMARRHPSESDRCRGGRPSPTGCRGERRRAPAVPGLG